MKVLLLSLGLGQYYCNYPIEEELINRGYQTYSICLSAFDLYKEYNEMEIEKYGVVIVNDLKFAEDFKRLNIKSNYLVSGIHTLAPKDEHWIRRMVEAGVDLDIEAGKYSLLTLGNDLKSNRNKIVIGGFPKMDYVIRNKDKRTFYKKALLDRFKFNKGWPIILYASTYSTGQHAGGTFTYCERILDSLKGQKLNLIVGPHPGDHKLLTNSMVIKNYNNVRVCLDFNKNDLILGSDLVISDNSSIILEASLADVQVMQLFKEEGKESQYLYSNPNMNKFIIAQTVEVPTELDILPKRIFRSIDYNPMEKEKEYWLNELCSGVTGNDAKKYVDEIERRLR